MIPPGLILIQQRFTRMFIRSPPTKPRALFRVINPYVGNQHSHLPNTRSPCRPSILTSPILRPAVALFNGPCYFAEQLGFRKIIDNTL